IWVLLVAIGLYSYRTPRSGAEMFGVIRLTAMIFARVSLRNVLSSAKLIFGLGLLLMLFHFFADPGEPVYRLGPLTITDGGLREGPIFFFRLAVVVLPRFVLIWTTDPRALMVYLNEAGVPYGYAFAGLLA